MGSTYDKGLPLELYLHDIFKSYGYNVFHNVGKEGRSGVIHQINLYAEYQAPLHTSRLVIETKSDDKPVDKNQIIQILQIVEDIGADKGIIVTTGSFTPGAFQIAENHNIDLWDGNKLSKILEKVKILNQRTAEFYPPRINGVVPRINLDQARSIIRTLLEERRQGGFLGIGKVEEQLENLVLWYYPYYEVELECTLYEKERVGLFNKKEIGKIISAQISIDALTGEIIDLDNGIIVYPFGSICRFSEEEIILLRTFARGWFLKGRLLAAGYSPGRLERVFKILLSKGLIQRARLGSRCYYRSNLAEWIIATEVRAALSLYPRKIQSLGTFYEIKMLNQPLQLFPGNPLEPSEVIEALINRWPETVIRRIEILHYPFYVFHLRRPDGSRRVEALDGVTGQINGALSKRISFSQRNTLTQEELFLHPRNLELKTLRG